VEYPSYTPANLAFLWMSKVLVPGVDLPDDQHWQVLEQELMRPEDYDAVLEMGWMEFVGAFMTERISGDVMLKLMEMMQLGPELLKLWHERGVPVIMTGAATTPYEMLCGARTLANLVMDMYCNGDMVQKVMDAALPFMAPQMIAITQQLGMSIMWIGGWRGGQRDTGQAAVGTLRMALPGEDHLRGAGGRSHPLVSPGLRLDQGPGKVQGLSQGQVRHRLRRGHGYPQGQGDTGRPHVHRG